VYKYHGFGFYMVTVWLSDQIWMAEIKREGDTTDNPNSKYHTKKKGKKRKNINKFNGTRE
jgi:hypothetical protein